MKKLFAVIPIAILIILLSSSRFIFASTYYEVGYCIIKQYDNYIAPGFYTLYCNNAENARYPYSYSNYLYLKVGQIGSVGFQTYIFDTRNNEYKPVIIGRYLDIAYIDQNTNPSNQFTDSIILNDSLGTSIIYANYDEFLNNVPPEYLPEEPTWWDILKENAQRVIRDVLELAGIPVDAAIDLDNWLSDLFTVKVGEGEDSLANQINTEPLPTPTPTPTPIPYQTVMTPDNNGGFTIQYIYNNPSGTPTAHPQPPSNNITNNYGSDFEYPYYENPENKDNPFKLKIPWYLKLILNNNDIPIETLDDHYLVAQNQIQSDDVLEAIDTVYNGFQVIPTDWLLILGAIACLPVFASLISRMLNG